MQMRPWKWRMRTTLGSWQNFPKYPMKVVWNFYPFDYENLLRVIQFATREMSIYMKTRGHLVGSERHAKQLIVVSELSRRLADDDYYDARQMRLADDNPKRFRRDVQLARYRARYDAFYLGRMFRFVQHWWD